MHLKYGTTTSLVVTISERFYSSKFYLYFADNFNAWPQNPSSSNPFQIFLDYMEIFRSNDLNNPKFVAHKRGVRKGIRANFAKGTPNRLAALRTVRVMGIHAIQPYLAILEVDTYVRARPAVTTIPPLLPPLAGSPTSIEYLVDDVQGPRSGNPDMHLQRLHF